MATPSRRSAGSGGSSRPANESMPLQNDYVGLDDAAVEENPDQFFGELFRGAHFQKLNKSSSVPAGGTIRVSGVVHFDAPSVIITSRGMRVRVSSPQLSQDYTQRFTDIQHCNSRRFSFDFPVPDNPGSRFSFSVTAESTKATGGWRTDSTRGPFNVQIQTETAATVTEGFTLIPAAAAGAGISYAGNRFLDTGYRDRTVAAAGAGAGVAYKKFGPPLPSIGGFVPDVSNTQLALVAAATFGAAYLLQSSGAAGILQPVGETAGGVIDAGRQAAGSAASAVQGGDEPRSRLSSPR